jgi:PAS domain S-box-containing protein
MKTTILLIEDSHDDAFLFQEMLAEAGGPAVELVHSDRLSKGLAHLGRCGIDAILLDLFLPDSSGFGTFAKLHAEAPHLPIVVLSGLDDEALAVRTVREGAQDYLVKGQVDGHLLVRSVRYAIERARAEAALAESEKLYSSLIESAQDAILIVNGETGLIKDANQAAQRMLGRKLESMRQLHEWDVVAPEEAQIAKERLLRVSKNSGLEPQQYHFISGNGLRTPVEARCNAIEVGKQKVMIGFYRDITERVRADVERTALIRELQGALAQVKTLSGCLPVCCSCRRIRDADGHWTDVESYISKHSEAVFSHDICPDCAGRLYPNVRGSNR